MEPSIRRQLPLPVWTVASSATAAGMREMPQQAQTRQTKTSPRWIVLFLAAVLVLAAFNIAWATPEDPMVVVFYKEGCPDCRRLDELLDGLSSQHSDLTIGHYEISGPRHPRRSVAPVLLLRSVGHQLPDRVCWRQSVRWNVAGQGGRCTHRRFGLHRSQLPLSPFPLEGVQACPGITSSLRWVLPCFSCFFCSLGCSNRRVEKGQRAACAGNTITYAGGKSGCCSY